MNKIFKKIIIGTVSASILSTPMVGIASSYTVEKGDTYWKVANNFGLNVDNIMKANNTTDKRIYPGEELIIPNEKYIVKKGDTPWIISNKLKISLDEFIKINGLNRNSYIYPGDVLKIPNTNLENEEENKNYKIHIAQKGDTYWNISEKYGIPFSELLEVNKANQNSYFDIGDKIIIPVKHIEKKETTGEKYGEYLDWWKEARYLLPRGTTFKVVDFKTGKSFMMKRTTGTNHADVEALTKQDTNIIKDIWGGFSWVRRPVIVEYNGRKIAASLSAMPHAGNDNAKGGEKVSWRSGEYGYGYNLDYVKNNGMNGVCDLHFLNSTRHKDGQKDPKHQESIKISSGMIK